MRRFTTVPALVTVGLASAALAASAAPVGAATQSQLEKAGWICIPAPPVTLEPHCARPAALQGLLTGEARAVTLRVFDFDGHFLGSDRLLRGDIYRRGRPPCPTDPSQTDPPTFEYTHLLETLGLDYYACHNYDSDHL
jgi:hypothetical protein